MDKGTNEKIKRLQVITLGDHTVGKTSILRRFHDGTFTFSTYPTVGIDFVKKDIKVGKEKVSVKIWDTAGQERFHTITHSFYKQCQGVLLVFDVGSKKTFDNIHKWMNNLKKHADTSIVKYLIGNKVDVDKREVSLEEAMKVAKDYDMCYFETSAKLNKNITEAITSLTQAIYDKTAANPAANGFGLSTTENKEPAPGGCCAGKH